MILFRYYAGLVLQTRKFGHCYVHASKRIYSLTINDIVFIIGSYGKSIQYGGHKFKVSAKNVDGTPISTKILKTMLNVQVV